MIEQRKMAASAGDNYKDILAQAISKIHSQEEESPSDIIGAIPYNLKHEII